MRRNWLNIVAVVAVLLLLGVVMAACGGSEEATPEPAVEEVPTVAEVAETPAEAPTAVTEATEAPAPAAAAEELTLFVGPNLEPCVGVAPQLCLLVRQSPDEDYRYFYDTIQGFTFEQGYEYELLVSRERRTNVPADASAFTYTLIEEVSKTPVEASASFEGTTWKLIAYTDANGQLTIPVQEVDATVMFQDGQLSGNAGCNNFFGSYTVDGNTLTIAEPLGSTMMACPDPLMAQEQAVLTNLASAASYQLVANQLQIFDANGQVVLAFEPLEMASLTGTNWSATMINNGRGAVSGLVAGTEVTAVFGEDGTVSGSAGCNTYSGSYTVDGSNITIGPLVSTMMMCVDPEVMAQEAAYLAALENSATYSITGDTLELRAADGALQVSYGIQEMVSLTGTNWVATGINNGRGGVASVVTGSEVTALFGEDGSVNGSAGCNNYFGDYEVDGANIAFGPMGTTRMMCEEDVMTQEAAYLAALENSATFAITGDTLELRAADGALQVSYTAGAAVAEAGAEPAAAVDAATMDALKNLSYQGTSAMTETVQLVDGVYETPAAPGSAAMAYVQTTDLVATGELNGQSAVAVVLNSSAGGSGMFYDLAVVTEQDGQWTNVATTYLGDRITVNSVAIENNQIVVDMITQGPDEPMCCPTQQVVVTYELQGEELVEVSREVVGAEAGAAAAETMPAAAPITGVVWQWTESLYGDGSSNVAADPARYTMEFLEDGNVALRADCNRVAGTYVLDGSSLSIQLGPSTMAACPPDSQADIFTRDVSAAASYVMDGEDLVISMKADTGTMRFAAAPAAEAVEEAPAAAFDPATVLNVSWQWEGTTTPVEEIAVASPGSYTLALLPGGMVQGKADCNRFRGTYTLEGQALTFGPFATTRMMCPPGSQSDAYLNQLAGAALVFTEGENMFIDLFADAGTMKFSRRLVER